MLEGRSKNSIKMGTCNSFIKIQQIYGSKLAMQMFEFSFTHY